MRPNAAPSALSVSAGAPLTGPQEACANVAIMTEDEARRALARFEQERQAAWTEQKPLLNAPEKIGFIGRDGAFREIKREPGKQDAWRSRNVKTFQSHEAAQFIHEEMQLFRQQNNVMRVHELVRRRLWEIAKARYPAADEIIVWDHVRMNRKRL